MWVRDHLAICRHSTDALCNLFNLTKDGAERILQGDDWKPSYERPSVNYVNEMPMPKRSRIKDDWRYSRNQAQHFTEAEREFIAKQFRDGVSAPACARQLQCSSRVIYTHYRRLRGDPPPEPRKPKPLKPRERRAMPDRASRFYRSTFEPN